MKGVWLATVGALFAATAAMFAFVLPAEFGVDPLGTGEALGLLGLAEAPPKDVSRTTGDLATDERSFELAPFESVELKYDLALGAGLVYSWTASGEVIFDFHAEVAGADPESAVALAQGRGTSDAGTYVARFDGIHGWFWENRGVGTVIVSLRTAGFATGATEYKDGDAAQVPFPLVRGR